MTVRKKKIDCKRDVFGDDLAVLDYLLLFLDHMLVPEVFEVRVNTCEVSSNVWAEIPTVGNRFIHSSGNRLYDRLTYKSSWKLWM